MTIILLMQTPPVNKRDKDERVGMAGKHDSKADFWKILSQGATTSVGIVDSYSHWTVAVGSGMTYILL